ncbi:hypothetical protein B7494_g6228 [Chlorociboria aeruginascens]|nr:hypothetical protein B7494_g6228 [Chlorociboria aeruginascens]
MSSFRKRNVTVAQLGSGDGKGASGVVNPEKKSIPGLRPSPLDGRLTTSTGTRSLDALLAGHAGLVLGSSLLVEESGATDFGGAILRYYAAEGIVQGHHVHVLGVSEAWGRELPGLSSSDATLSPNDQKKTSEEKMKIAWRYERLGEFGVGARERSILQATGMPSASNGQSIFCHDFDLSKRLILPSLSQIHFIQINTGPSLDFTAPGMSISPFTRFLSHLSTQLSAGDTIHRVIIPTLLSPALYPQSASNPEHIIQFLHSLRALLRKYPTKLTAVITLPLTLFPRTSGLTRWMELLSDGVLELAPFPSTATAVKPIPGSTNAQEEPPQGMLKIHQLPVFHEKGGGGGEASGLGDDLAFILSRRKGFVIKPYNLPPVEGNPEAQQGGLEGDEGRGKTGKVDIEF